MLVSFVLLAFLSHKSISDADATITIMCQVRKLNKKRVKYIVVRCVFEIPT